MQSDSYIELCDVSCILDGQVITSPINAKIFASEVVALIGKNGAGKTTLLRTIAGLLRNFSGSIFIDGQDIRKLSQTELAKHISYLPQRLEPFLSLSVEEVLLAGRFAHLNGAWGFSSNDHRRVVEVKRRLCLEEFSHRKFGKLSSGEQQRVLIGSAICQEASFLVLDEPSAFLDPLQEILLFETLKDLNVRDGVGIIVASHNLRVVERYATRVLALKDGAVVHDGSTSLLDDEAFQVDIFGGKLFV